ncbi:hypothetical protein NHX12_027381, partial [Muraenolepis orangiensis]
MGTGALIPVSAAACLLMASSTLFFVFTQLLTCPRGGGWPGGESDGGWKGGGERKGGREGEGFTVPRSACNPEFIIQRLVCIWRSITVGCPWLALTISPTVPPCCALLFVFVLANFTMATFMDAGILPMANEDEDGDDDFRAPLYKNTTVNGVQLRMKWCASCHFYRPPRCSHCSVCDRCVEVSPHHHLMETCTTTTTTSCTPPPPPPH